MFVRLTQMVLMQGKDACVCVRASWARIGDGCDEVARTSANVYGWEEWYVEGMSLLKRGRQLGMLRGV